jgi:hypothetical protein
MIRGGKSRKRKDGRVLSGNLTSGRSREENTVLKDRDKKRIRCIIWGLPQRKEVPDFFGRGSQLKR